MTPRPRITPVAAAAALLAGCAISNPQASTTVPQRPAAAPAPTGVRTPAAVLDAQRERQLRVAVDYTLTQATWSADTYLAQRARLAERATGRALAQLADRDGQPPAAVAARLRAARSSSRASLLGTDGPSAEHDVVVAYKVLATGTGRTPKRADYQLAHVTLTRRDGAWLISRFAIQP
jgi:hypothetical protein